MQKTPHVGEVGHSVDVSLGQDISAATNPRFVVRKPSGTVIVWTATPFADAAGVVSGLRHVATAADLNEAGVYKIHPYLTLGDWTGPAGDVIDLTVRPLFA